MNKSLLFTGALALSLAGNSQTFSDNFDSYNAGDYIGVVNPTWTTWSGTTGGAEDAQVTAAQAASAPHSIYFSSTASGGGPQDVILPFTQDFNTGTFNYKKKMYVESGKGAYFNFQGTSTPGQIWSLNCQIDETGLLNIFEGTTFATTTITHDTWFELELNANLNTNEWELYIDGALISSFQINELQISSVDLFPVNASNSQSGFYIDDIEYTHTPYTLPATNAGVSHFVFPGGLAGLNSNPVVQVRNLGTNALTSFDVELTYDGNTYTETVTGVNIPSLGTMDVTISTPITVAAGNNAAVACVANVNGNATDDDNADDCKTLDIDPVVPAPNKVVVGEEGTGTWCPWCTRGTVFLDSLTHTYGDLFIGIAVHNGDVMTDDDWDNSMNAFYSGYPSMVMDRGADIDPSGAFAPFLERIAIAPAATMVHGATYDATTRELKVSVTTTFAQSVTGDYRISCAVIEDNVTGTTSDYDQANAYAGGGSGVMGGYELLPNPVPAAQMVYQHVARQILPQAEGHPNAFTSMNMGDTETHTFTFILDAGWDESEIKIVSMIHAPDTKIDNGAISTIPEAETNGYVSGTEILGLEELTQVDNLVNLYPNPTNGNSTLTLNLKEQSEVIVEITAMNGKLVASKNYGQLNGGQNIQLNSNGLAKGIYLVKVIANNKMQTAKLIVE